MKKYVNCFPPKEEIPGYNPEAGDNEYFFGYYWWVQPAIDIAGTRLDTEPTMIEMFLENPNAEVVALMTGNEVIYSEEYFPNYPYYLVGPIETPTIEELEKVNNVNYV